MNLQKCELNQLLSFNKKSVDQKCNSKHMLLRDCPLNTLSVRKIYFEIAKFHVKLFKAQKIQREYNEKQNEFNVQNELQKLEQQVTSNVRKEFEKNLETTSKQTKELESELKKLQTTSKGLGNKLEELEKKLESNFETTSTQTKELNNKLEELEKKLDHKFEEILKILR